MISIGAICNLNGSQAPLDILSSQGALLAAEVINAQEPERKVQVILKDGESNGTQIAAAARELADDPDVGIIIGLSDTDMVVPAMEALKGTGLLFLTSGATSPLLPLDFGDNLYLACFGDNAQGAVAAEYAAEDLSAKTAVVMYDSSMNYTTLIAGYFTTRFEELGGPVLQDLPILPGNEGLVKAIETLSEDQPDILYLAVGPDDAPGVINLLDEAGIDIPVFGGDSYDTPELAEAAGSTGMTVYYTTHASFADEGQIPEVAAFIAAYNERYQTMPDAFAGFGYDAVHLAVQAVLGSEPDGVIHQGFSKIQGFKGVTGVYSYEHGSSVPEKSVTLMRADSSGQVKNRGFCAGFHPPCIIFRFRLRNS